MKQNIVGIDIAKDTLEVCLMANEKIGNQQFPNSTEGHHRLGAWLKKQKTKPLHICLEATGQYGNVVAEFLYEQNYTVSVVNPARIKAFGQSKLRRNKTDKADAQLIADFCASQKPTSWTPPPASFKELQALIRHLEDLQTSRQQDLLASIPGIGKLTAAKLLGEIREITEFDSARQLAAYPGLTPKNFSSGSSVHKKSRLSKTGNAHLRKILYMPAISAKRWNPIVSTFCKRLATSGLTPLQQIGAAMRKLLHLILGILKSDRPFNPDYLVNVQAFS